MKKLYLAIILTFSFLYTMGQNSSETEKKNTKNKALTLRPIVFSTPETGFSVGGIGYFQKHLFNKGTDYRKSNIYGIATYSFDDQILASVIPDIFFKEEKFRFRGRFGFNKTLNRYWGIGNETPDSNEEEITYSQIQVEPSFYYKLLPNLFAGIQYRFLNQYNVDLEETSLLSENENLLNGSSFSISGLGPSILFDNRRNQINPTQGWFVDSNITFHDKGLGSDLNFTRIVLDTRHYFRLTPNTNNILAVQTYGLFTFGDVPWNQLGELGGDQLRGYFKGRFRDNNMVALQTEYRSPLLFWKISAVGFTGLGRVVNSVDDFSFKDFKPSYGGGLRVMISEEKRLNIRFDVAFGENGNSGIYVGLREAF